MFPCSRTPFRALARLRQYRRLPQRNCGALLPSILRKLSVFLVYFLLVEELEADEGLGDSGDVFRDTQRLCNLSLQTGEDME